MVGAVGHMHHNLQTHESEVLSIYPRNNYMVLVTRAIGLDYYGT